MKAFIIVLLLILPLQSNSKDCLEMDIVILCDLSGSIENYEDFVEQAIIGLVEKIDLSEHTVRIGVIGFNDLPFVIAGLSGNKDELIKLIKDFPFYGNGFTYMANGVRISSNMLFADRHHVQKMLIVISDGDLSDTDNTSAAINEMEDFNVSICGVFIKTASAYNDHTGQQYMRKISGLCYVETYYENLAKELAKMEICL